MKGENFNAGMPLRKEDFDHLQDSVSEAIRERSLDLFTQGVVIDSQLNGESEPFLIEPDGVMAIKVGSGVAVGRQSTGMVESVDNQNLVLTGGERIVIPAADTTTNPANNWANSPGAGPGTGTGTGTYYEVADGLNGWVSAPQSTKTRSIPVINGSMNYVWLCYVRTIDSSVYLAHKLTLENLYPYGKDGYAIVVNQSAIAPGSDPKYILLGTVDLTLSPISVSVGDISNAGRVHASIRPKRVSVRLDATLAPASYSNASPNTVMAEDHFNAVGSGTVTEKNAHGLEFEDMGHSFIDVDLITHRKRHHSNGVITDNEADSSRGLTPSTSSLTPIGGDAAAVFLRKFNAVFGEHAIVNGGHYTDVLPKLVAPLGSYVVGDAYVSFPSGGAGTYAIVLKIVGSDLTVERRIAPYTIDTFADLIIAEVVWNGSAFTGITDLRVFGSIGSKDMQALSVGTSELKDDAVISRNIDIADGSSASDPNSGSGIASDHIKIDAVLSKHVADADGTSASVSSSGSGIATPHLRDLVATSQKIALADGTSGQVTTTGSGIKTGHIQDEAITLQKLAVALQGLLSTGIAPTGSITAFGGGTAPTGWYECNGQPVSRVGVGAALFAAVGTRWGSGDGVNTFNVPDLRGVVLRGLNGTSADAWSDPDVLTRVARPIAGNIIGTAVGNNVGSFQTDEFKSHHHDTTIASAPVSNGIQGGSGTALTNPPTITGDTGGNETRMKNAAVMYIIKS